MTSPTTDPAAQATAPARAPDEPAPGRPVPERTERRLLAAAALRGIMSGAARAIAAWLIELIGHHVS